MITDNKPSNIFLIDAIKSARPPKSFQSLKTLLRASDDLLINPLSVSLTDVNISLASSKLPITICQVLAHPEPAASFKVSHNWVNVLTLVAASSAVFAKSIISCTWDSEYPFAKRSASEYAPDIWDKVSVNTSAVSHSPSVSDSLNEPYFSIIASTFIPIFSAVRFNAFWNNSPPIPALTTEFQSWSATLPVAKAWESWYMAVLACWDVEPETAAKLAIPLIELTDSFNPTPAAVKVPILRVISLKL